MLNLINLWPMLRGSAGTQWPTNKKQVPCSKMMCGSINNGFYNFRSKEHSVHIRHSFVVRLTSCWFPTHFDGMTLINDPALVDHPNLLNLMHHISMIRWLCEMLNSLLFNNGVQEQHFCHYDTKTYNHIFLRTLNVKGIWISTQIYTGISKLGLWPSSHISAHCFKMLCMLIITPFMTNEACTVYHYTDTRTNTFGITYTDGYMKICLPFLIRSVRLLSSRYIPSMHPS